MCNRATFVFLALATVVAHVCGQDKIPMNKAFDSGKYSSASGSIPAEKAACGKAMEMDTTLAAAVPCEYWASFPSGDPKADPMCQGVFVEVSFGNVTLKIPVMDACCSCSPTQIMLSAFAFKQLGIPEGVPMVFPGKWKFVKDGSSSSPAPPGGASSPQPVTQPSGGAATPPSGGAATTAPK